MIIRQFLLAGAAALALGACGGKDDGADAPTTETSAQAAKTSAPSPLERKFALKDAEAVDFDRFVARLPADLRPTYDEAAFDASLGATVVANMRFADEEDGEAVVIERAEFYGLDEEAIDRVATAEDAGPDAPFETIFEKVRLLNVRSEGFANEEEGRVAEVLIDGVEFDKLAVRQGGFEGNSDGDEGANFFNAVSLGGLYFQNVAVTAVEEEVQEFGFSTPDLRIVGLAGGKIDAIIAKDLSYNFIQGPAAREVMREAMGPQGAALLDGPLAAIVAPESQKATIESFEWRDIDFSGAVEYGVKGEEPPATEKDLIDLGSMKVANMTSYIEDRPVATVGEISAPVMKFAWMIPSQFRFDIADATTDYTAYVPDEENPAYEIIKAHGLDDVKSEGFAEWNWNPDKGDGRLNYDIASPGLGDFSMTMALAGANLKEIAAAQEEGAENPFAENAKLESLNLKIADEKALEAIFDLAALQMGGTGADLRQSAPALIRLSSAQFAQLNPRIQDYANALADFISKGGALEIAAEPEEPIGAADLQDGSVQPQALPDVFNLTVTHTE